MAALAELVPQYTSNENKNNRNSTSINWSAISKIIKRRPVNCKDKWTSMQAKKLKKGRFTAEEDDIIKQRKAEWGDKGEGLWVSLKKELGRPAGVICTRWKLTLSKRV